GDALEPADHRNIALLQQPLDIMRAYLQNTGVAEFPGRDDPCLAPGERNGLEAARLERVGKDDGGDDLPASHHHVHLTRGGLDLRVNLLQNFDQRIGGVGRARAANRRDHDDGMEPGLPRLDDLARGQRTVFRPVYGGAAEFLDQDLHAAASRLVTCTQSALRRNVRHSAWMACGTQTASTRHCTELCESPVS